MKLSSFSRAYAVAVLLMIGGSNAQAQFGFLQNPSTSSNGFGSNAWTSGFSNALVQLPQSYQAPNSAPQFAPMRMLQLGAYLENTTTGVLIRDVVPGGIAAANGFEPGDTIVTVAGYQVGIVNDRIYDAVDEIQKRTDASGGCSMLILDRSSNRLTNFRLDISGTTTPSVSGQAFVQQSINIPQGSHLRVELRNLTRPFQQIDGGSDLRPITGFGPYSFEIHYNPVYITQGDRYRLVASVIDPMGQTLMQGSSDIAAPAGRVQTSVQMMPGVVTASGTTSVGYAPDYSTVTQMFQRILGRVPDAGELNAWSMELAKGTSLDGLKAELLASRQFFDQSGNNNNLYVQRMFQALTGRNPNSNEVSMMLSKLSSYGNSRVYLVKDLMNQGYR
ncbi:MAG: YbaY family lipoprotein [Pirellulales bacterium]